jgi:hypothetical protein
MLKAERGVDICVLRLKVQATSATQSGYDLMREPREYEAPLCAEVGGDYWHPEDLSGVGKYEGINLAKRICGNCRHQIECAEWGIQKERFGIWGGLLASERKKIRRKRGVVLPVAERDKSA